MYYVYILKLSNKQFYTGYSADLKRRIREHSSGNENTTKKYLPIKLVFYEAFLDKEDALRREKYFKTSKGKNVLKIMMREYLDKK